MEIGIHIKRIRKELGMTQAELAEKTDLKQYLITKYENGIRTPLAEKIERIAQALGVTVNDLYGTETKEQKVLFSQPSKGTREGKMISTYRELNVTQQRALLQQAEGLLLTNQGK